MKKFVAEENLFLGAKPKDMVLSLCLDDFATNHFAWRGCRIFLHERKKFIRERIDGMSAGATTTINFPETFSTGNSMSPFTNGIEKLGTKLSFFVC